MRPPLYPPGNSDGWVRRTLMGAQDIIAGFYSANARQFYWDIGYRPHTQAYFVSRGTTEGIWLAIGTVSSFAGGAMVWGGGTISISGGGAVIGVPAAAVGGLVLAPAGVWAAGQAAANRYETQQEAIKFAERNGGSSGGMNNAQATQAANQHGYTKTNYRSHGQPVFKRGNRYITPDVDSHSGGVWKMADSPQNLGSKSTRMGTYDANLVRIGP